MPRKQPKEAEKARMKTTIRESSDDLIQKAIRESTEKRLRVTPKPGPAAAEEMWLSGGSEPTILARVKRKKRKENYA